MKRCTHCLHEKPEQDFGGSSWCRQCGAERARARRAANRAATREADRARWRARPERAILKVMIQRCHNQHHPKWRYYGGRGLAVCPEWHGRGGFALFFAHVGPRPSDQHEIDRIDNARGYEPGNVRWVTRVEQRRNMRSNVLLTLDGRTQCVTAWAEELGVDCCALRMRLKRGWPVERTLRTPVRPMRRAAA